MRGLRATFRNAVAEALSNRAAFGGQLAVMITNDLIWVVFWLLFFREVGDLRGWDADLILLLLSVLAAAGGISIGILANARQIGRMAIEGELDAVLSLPVPPLGFLLLRRIEAVALGDLFFGIVLFAVTGSPTIGRTAVYVGVVLAATTILTSFLVLTGSLGFFMGRNEAGELGVHAMLILGAYPVDLFAGVAKVVLYTIVPAVFVAAVPAHLVNSFDAGKAVALAVVAALFAAAAWLTFTLGLRRYTSGSVWTRA